MHTPGPSGAPPGAAARAFLAFSTLGIVFGDIGTSPLYALRACFSGDGVPVSESNVLGVLSLVFWSLVLVISVKYLGFIMRADNQGEGGILALMSLALPRRARSRAYVLMGLGLFGAALLYGDGLITPAISVLGAMEGLEEATPALKPLVIPLTVVVLIGLFVVQRRGTAGVSAFFSPITLAWFVAIALLGASAIARQPDVLRAASPLHAADFLASNGVRGFFTLGFVFLVVTGGEALYADMGHFGRGPIRLAWFAVVLPALLLNYFGQGALLLTDPTAAANPFYRLVPRPLLYPMIGLATAAAVVASQALISGAFSLTRQAVQLGYAPRMTIVHTSGAQAGQIFVPAVNRALMVGCILLVLAFGSTERLAAAYGIAVTATMAITTVLFDRVARIRLGWKPWAAHLLTAGFLTFDLAFFGANIVKIRDGGWVPVGLAVVLYVLMLTWHQGLTRLRAIGRRYTLPLEIVLRDAPKVCRVPGTGVFMNPEPDGTPLVLLHHLKHNQSLHERVVLFSILTEEVPAVPVDERVTSDEIGHGFYRVLARYGFMETPDAPAALATSEVLKGKLDPGRTTYYLGRQTLIPARRGGMSRWRKQLFLVMARNALRPTAYFNLPPNRVVELGAQVQF